MRCFLLLLLLTLGLSGGLAQGQVLLSPAFQEEKPAESPKDQEAKPRVVTLHAAGEPDPALRYRFWPAFDKRRNASPHPFLSRAMLLATQALAQDRDHAFSEFYDRISELPLDQLPIDEVRQFLDKYATPALKQLSEIDRLMDTTYDLQLEGRSLSEVLTLVLPEVQESRQLARLLAVRARLAIAEKRWDDAVDDLRVGFRLAEIIVESAPLLVSKAVGFFAIAGVMLSVVGEAIQQPGCPNLYWALATVPTSQLYHIRMEFEVGSIARVLRVSDASTGLVGADAARRELVSLARQLLELILLELIDESSSRGTDDNDAIARLMAGVYVIAMVEPSRELLAASDDWSQRVASLSAAEAVWLATRLRLLRTRDDWTKWNLLPADLNINVEDKLSSEKFDVRSADVVTLMAQLLMPALTAADTVSRRMTQQHHFQMTLEAMRMHAAHSGELPESLDDLHPVPALPDSIAQGPFDYQRISATTATLTHAPRWRGDRENTVSIQLVVDEE